MNRTNSLLSVALLLALATASVGEHHESSGTKPAWFDCESCAICKPMSDNTALMEGMQWEAHKIANGMVMTTVVAESMRHDFVACHHEMKARAGSVGPGDPLCGFCAAYGELIEAGAKEESVETGFGAVTLVTSDDPSLVAKIHAHADRSTAEMAKMTAE